MPKPTWRADAGYRSIVGAAREGRGERVGGRGREGGRENERERERARERERTRERERERERARASERVRKRESEKERERKREERERARARQRGNGRTDFGQTSLSSYTRAGADHGLELLNAAPVAGSNGEEGNGEAGVGRKLLQGKGAASERGVPVVPALWTAGNTPRQVLGMYD